MVPIPLLDGPIAAPVPCTFLTPQNTSQFNTHTTSHPLSFKTNIQTKQTNNPLLSGQTSSQGSGSCPDEELAKEFRFATGQQLSLGSAAAQGTI